MEHEDHIAYIKALGKRIQELRKERGMTQLDLATRAEMEENALQRLEAGRTNPTIKTLWRVSRALNVDVPELLATRKPRNE